MLVAALLLPGCIASDTHTFLLTPLAQTARAPQTQPAQDTPATAEPAAAR